MTGLAQRILGCFAVCPLLFYGHCTPCPTESGISAKGSFCWSLSTGCSGGASPSPHQLLLALEESAILYHGQKSCGWKRFEKSHRDSYLKQPVTAVLLTSSSACGCHDDHESLLKETACTACGMSQYQQQWSLRSLRGSSAWRLQTCAHRATRMTQILSLLLEPTATISPLYHRGPTGVPRALHPVPSPPALCLPCSLPFERFCL